MSFRCRLFGHAWDRPLNDAEGKMFCRIDCTRPKCGYAMDAVPLLRIAKDNPDLWNRVKGSMPKYDPPAKIVDSTNPTTQRRRT